MRPNGQARWPALRRRLRSPACGKLSAVAERTSFEARVYTGKPNLCVGFATTHYDGRGRERLRLGYLRRHVRLKHIPDRCSAVEGTACYCKFTRFWSSGGVLELHSCVRVVQIRGAESRLGRGREKALMLIHSGTLHCTAITSKAAGQAMYVVAVCCSSLIHEQRQINMARRSR